MGSEASKATESVTDNEAFRSISNFHPGYVRKLKERFELAKESFTLDKDDLHQLFNSSEKEIATIFQYFDLDGDGIIDQYEFTTALAFLSHGSLEEKAKLIFELYDFDKSQYISKDELTILMTNCLTSLRAMTKQDAPTVEEVEKKTEEFFLKSDLDGNERVTLEEFINFVKSDKVVIQCLLGYGIARAEDLGVDLSDGRNKADGYYDMDLENELQAQRLAKDAESRTKLDTKKAGPKYGADFDIQLDEAGRYVEKVPEADQQAAAPQWKEAAMKMAPSGYSRSRQDQESPDASLDLEYVYGYRCHDVRNNLRYNADGRVVYHAAGVGIVLNQGDNSQQFMLEHDDDILCLAVDASGQYCVTGQVGAQPWLCVWDTTTMECLARYQAPLTIGIKSVAFSPDSELVVASGLDQDHSLAVFKWRSIKDGKLAGPIATGKGPRADIWSLGFSGDNNTIVATCTREVNFYTYVNGIIKAETGTGWSKAPGAILCQAFVETMLFTGTHDGQIIEWAGQKAGKSTKAHDSPVYAMCARTTKRGLVTGGQDGVVIVWSIANGLVVERKFDLRPRPAPGGSGNANAANTYFCGLEVKSLSPSIKSVCEHPRTGQVLVGTRGGEIIEFAPSTSEKPKVLLKSHYDKGVLGVAAHPNKQEFMTVGRDGMLCVWDIATRRQKRYAKLECGADSVAYSNDGNHTAIGMRNGYLLVVDANCAPVAKTQHSKSGKEISIIKFSPDNAICAVGGHDGRLRLYDVTSRFRKAKVIKKNTSAVTHLDFSKDGQFMMTNNLDGELLFFESASGKHISDCSALKDTQWLSWSCVFGWPMQGITQANKSNIIACSRSRDGNVLATGDDLGRVGLHRFPCPQKNSSYNLSIGHSATVAGVSFSTGTDHLLTCGGADLCVMQWKYQYDPEAADDAGLAREVNKMEQGVHGKNNELEGLYELQDLDIDRAKASKPFLQALALSSPPQTQQASYVPPPSAALAPEANLRLKYVHGFRSHDTRGNAKFSADGKVVYTTAGLGVVLDTKHNSQDFFNLHQDDVVSLALHPNRDIAATGTRSVDGQAKLVDIFVWKISTQEVLACISGFHRYGVDVLKFSSNGSKLLSIGQDKQHSLAVYDWVNKSLLCTIKTGPDKVFDAAWKSEDEFMTVSAGLTQFYSLRGKNIISRKGTVGQQKNQLKDGVVHQHICCTYAFQGTMALSGNQSGDILQWEADDAGSGLTRVHRGHTAPLWQIICIENQTRIVSGGADCKMIFWDQRMSQLQAIDLNALQEVYLPEIRALDFNEQDKTFLVGTRGGEILEVSTQGKKLATLLRGHQADFSKSKGAGIACHPKEQLFASCGMDRRVRVWSEETQIAQVLMPFEDQVDASAIDWSPCGQFLIVGDTAGRIHSIDSRTLKVVGTIQHQSQDSQRDSREPVVQDAKISPDGLQVAFGVRGNSSSLQLVSIDPASFVLKSVAVIKCSLMNGGLASLDWSTDSKYLAINSAGQELLFVNASTQQEITGDQVKDLKWHTWTSAVGFGAQGVWPDSYNQNTCSVARSHDSNLIASAEDSGIVKLFRYPSMVKKAAFRDARAHSSTVNQMAFSAKDQFLVTVSGQDRAVCVWTVELGDEQDDDGVQNIVDIQDSIEVDLVDHSRIDKEIWKAKRRTIADREARAAQAERGADFKDDDEELFNALAASRGQEPIASKPWKGSMRAPTKYTKPPKNQELAPHVKATIDWVHGYRGYKSKNNVKYLADGAFAYFTAGLGVVFDPQTRQQRHFDKHSDDMTAMAISSDLRTVATGELGRQPKVIVWDAISMQVLQEFQGQLSAGIKSLCFSPSRKYLVAVDASSDHKVAVFNLETSVCIQVASGDKAQISEVAFRDDTSFVTVGVGHFKLWTIGKGLKAVNAAWQSPEDRSIGCVAFNGKFALTGSSLGTLTVWDDNKVKSSTEHLHARPIDAICVTKTHAFTGSRDKDIHVLDLQTYSKLFTINLGQPSVGPESTQPRAIDLDHTQTKLVVGTFGCEIYEIPIDLSTAKHGKPEALVHSHYAPKLRDTNEVWGLCTMQGTDKFVTVSDDATLRVWSAKTRSQVHVVDLNRHADGKPLPPDPQTKDISLGAQARCVDVSPDGSLCAIGYRSGRFRVFQTSTWAMVVAKKSPMKAWLEDIKFSPEAKNEKGEVIEPSRYLAVSSHDGNVYVFAMPNVDLHCTLSGSQQFVSHMDWSLNGQYLRTNDDQYQVLFYDVAAGQHEANGAVKLRDVEWETASCPVTWASQGIWTKNLEGADINHCDRSQDYHPDGYRILASGDDFGQVRLARYPSMVHPSKNLVLHGHSSHVTKVKFGPMVDGALSLFSIGGNDTTVIQWRVEWS